MNFNEAVFELYVSMVIKRLESIVKLYEYRILLYSGSIRGNILYSCNLEYNITMYNVMANLYKAML